MRVVFVDFSTLNRQIYILLIEEFIVEEFYNFMLSALDTDIIEHGIPALICFILATILIAKNKKYWGWFLLFGFLFTVSY